MHICQCKLEKLKVTLSQDFRTAKSWLMHIYYLDVLKRFIIAEEHLTGRYISIRR